MAKIPTKITARIDYWESKGLSKMRSANSKIYKETVQKLGWLIDGTNAFKGEEHTMNDFRLSVDRFALQALSLEYQPIKKKNIKNLSLARFLYNPFCPHEFRSQYKTCLVSIPLPIHARYPNIYRSLSQAYLESYNNGTKTIGDLTIKDQSNLGWAANKIGKFCKDHMGKTNKTMGSTQKRIVVAFLKAAKSFTSYNPTKFSTGLLTRAWVWEKFPNYLDQQGYLLEEKPFSMYTWKS